jgi:hypothetical protein
VAYSLRNPPNLLFSFAELPTIGGDFLWSQGNQYYFLLFIKNYFQNGKLSEGETLDLLKLSNHLR